MKKVNLLLNILFLFCISCFIVVFLINQNVIFELNGDDNITVEVNSIYNDEGVTARIFKKDLSNNVQIKNKVDYSKPGTYNINYYLTYTGKVYMLTRTVNVIDNTK